MSNSKRKTLADADPLQDEQSEDNIDENELEALLIDYQEAAEEGRYRDQFLHYTYYLALVALGLVLNFGFDLYKDPRSGHLIYALFSAGGALVFFILLVWAESFRNARNASWARQSEIEDYLAEIRPGLLRANDSIPNRLRFESYQYGNKSWLEQRSVGTYMKFLLVFLVGLFLTGTIVEVSIWGIKLLQQ
jgi:hypothetical protein